MKEEKKNAQQTDNVAEGLRNDNMMSDTAITNALSDIEKEKDDSKKRQAKRAICVATYVNRKTVLQLQQRRREDDITKEKLDKSKKLLERLIGFETEIKDGSLVPTKKKIDAKERLTPVEFEEETRKMSKEIAEKMKESNATYDKQHKELRNSYEGEYRYWINDFYDF